MQQRHLLSYTVNNLRGKEYVWQQSFILLTFVQFLSLFIEFMGNVNQATSLKQSFHAATVDIYEHV